MKEQVIREIDLDKRFKKKCWGQSGPHPLQCSLRYPVGDMPVSF